MMHHWDGDWGVGNWLLMGFGLPGENAHAPNEWMSEENFTRGLRAVAMLYQELAR